MNDEARATSGTPAAADHRSAPLPLQPGLYVVATPIGNLGDITNRAVEVLRAVDLIACEDTRVTAKLAQRFALAAPLVAYHDHNADEMRPRLLARLARGERVALVSDAGTPLISDPGYKLVRAAADQGAAVIPIPGASSVLAALCVAGLPTDRFAFFGFLPRSGERRAQALADLARTPASLVLFETGPRLADTLAELAGALGPRQAAIGRELTKLHEEVRRGPLDDLARGAGQPKGELVIVIAPPAAPAAGGDAAIDAALAALPPGLPMREAVDRVIAATGAARRVVYARALAQRHGAED